MAKSQKIIVCIIALIITTSNAVICQSISKVKKLDLNLEEFQYDINPNDKLYESRKRKMEETDSIRRAQKKYSLYDRKMIHGDTVRTLSEHEDVYYITERINNSAFWISKRYLKPSLILLGETELFYSLKIITRSYDENGNLIKIRDFEKEKGFSFTIEMLVKKIKTEFNIDLTFPKGYMIVSRSGGQNPRYKIIIADDIYSLQRVIKINGVTGSVMSDEVVRPHYGPTEN